MTPGRRSPAALLKGGTILAFGIYVLVTTVIAALGDGVPHAGAMGIVGTVALAANGAVALMLYRYRSGDANMRSVWICSRNDAIGNLAVLGAAVGVVGTGTQWPDLMVAAIMAALGIVGGSQILRHALGELSVLGEPDDRDALRTRSSAVAKVRSVVSTILTFGDETPQSSPR